MTKPIALTAALLAVATAGFGQSKVAFRQLTGKVEISIDGRPFTTFYRGADWAQPFLHPLRTAGGTIVTRGYPLDKMEGDSEDHVWHHGLWWGFKVYDKNHKLVTYDNQGGAEAHQDNFVECVRSRKAPAAEIEIGHISAAHCHLGNIVARTGRNLKFDAKTETVTGDGEANALVKRQYRAHWATPKGV